jgi:hypothetical protein
LFKIWTDVYYLEEVIQHRKVLYCEIYERLENLSKKERYHDLTDPDLERNLPRSIPDKSEVCDSIEYLQSMVARREHKAPAILGPGSFSESPSPVEVAVHFSSEKKGKKKKRKPKREASPLVSAPTPPVFQPPIALFE